MKKTKKVECEKLDEVVCDICGQSCKKDFDNEFASLTATWGYNSKKDLTRHDIDLCEGCFDKTIGKFKIYKIPAGPNNNPKQVLIGLWIE